MEHMDGAEISVSIDLDQGARIASLQWRDLQFVVPFRGTPISWGWYAMAPWAGRIRDGLITGANGEVHTLPTMWDPPNAIHGYGFTSSWQELGPGRARLELPAPYNGAIVEQTIEILDDAVRWILEYEANGCDLPAWIGMHPWFPRELERGDVGEMHFDASQMLLRGDDGLPTGELVSIPKEPWDDAFTGVRGVPSIIWEGAAKLTIESDAPWWTVYSEDTEGIAIEPQTAPPDAANLGIVGDHYLEALFTFSED
jgi:aldose 1-epimerase